MEQLRVGVHQVHELVLLGLGLGRVAAYPVQRTDQAGVAALKWMLSEHKCSKVLACILNRRHSD